MPTFEANDAIQNILEILKDSADQLNILADYAVHETDKQQIKDLSDLISQDKATFVL